MVDQDLDSVRSLGAGLRDALPCAYSVSVVSGLVGGAAVLVTREGSVACLCVGVGGSERRRRAEASFYGGGDLLEASLYESFPLNGCAASEVASFVEDMFS